MDLKTSVKAGIEIVENIEVRKRFKFDVSKITFDEAEDIVEALNMGSIKGLDDLYYEDPPSYEVSYRNKDIQFCINANELENFINKLVIKEHFKTLKVKSEHIKEVET
ncbi:hypothetical protein [Staphylococcus aureus]|uniref:hypothetical protein n=1 Tax=Staphylococcus aureus TaxID=1280 RepID=UPI001248D976|nr:hypothetical protein [Staphylococcus aureus]